MWVTVQIVMSVLHLHVSAHPHIQLLELSVSFFNNLILDSSAKLKNLCNFAREQRGIFTKVYSKLLLKLPLVEKPEISNGRTNAFKPWKGKAPFH